MMPINNNKTRIKILRMERTLSKMSIMRIPQKVLSREN